MDRVTLVWVARGGASTKVLALPKAAVAGVVGGFFLFLALAAGSLYWVRAVSQESASRIAEIQGLAEAVGRLSAERDEGEAAARELLRQNQRMEEELQEIRATEGRIRRFLGLNEPTYDEKRSHQGGMGSPGDEEGPLGGGPLPFGEDEAVAAGFAEVSRTLRTGLQEVVAHLEERKAESRRIPLILPVESEQVWLSSAFGWRDNPLSGLGREFHNGVDIAGPWKTPILAPADGEVEQVGKDRRLGVYMKLRHGSSVQTIYGHMASAAVKAGKRVKRGEVIGHMGNTGRSTGTHLHYSVSVGGKYVDPQDYIWDRPFRTLKL
ncbi:MAG: M23 family metallopeptidase [Thermodesulfobacteriota bacterium]